MAQPPLTCLGVLRKIKHIFICGTGFLADAYDLFVINVVKDIMAKIYPQTIEDTALISSMALAGAVIGQVFFGLTADYFGRKTLFIMTLVLLTVGVLGSALSYQIGSLSIYTVLAFWRFILGLGVGGEYPLSATVTKDTSDPESSGRDLGLVFSMQGLGAFLSAVVVVILLHSPASYEVSWRVALAFGAVPTLAVFYWRHKMQESMITAGAVATPHRLATSWETRKLYVKQFFTVLRRHSKNVAAAALAWFLLDVVFYANGLFSNSILIAMNLGSDLRSSAVSTVAVTAMAIPGYYLAVLTLDRLGRKWLQMAGFILLATVYLILGLLFTQLLHTASAVFLILYGLTFLFSNWGPNATTYIIPGELFPTEVRATCHGLCAASGKIGAVVGAAMLAPLKANYDVSGVLIACGAVSGLGAVCTLLLTPNYHPRELAPKHLGERNADAEALCEQNPLVAGRRDEIGLVGSEVRDKFQSPIV